MIKLHEFARKYIGVKEYGKNSGFSLPDPSCMGFEQGMRNMGWRPGMPWCAFFIKFCVHEVYGSKYSLHMNGGVDLTWKNLAKNPLFTTTQNSYKEGDLVFWDAGEGRGHCGIVLSNSPSPLSTIEGNTNKTGSREGDGVWVKSRSINGTSKWKLLGFARPVVKEEEKPILANSSNENNSASV